MTCSTGACAVNASGMGRAQSRIPRHCCEECAQDAVRSHPVLRSFAKPTRGLVIVPQRLVAVGGRELAPVMDYPSAHPMAVIGASGKMLPTQRAGSPVTPLGNGQVNYAAQTLRALGMTCEQWSQLSWQDKERAAAHGAGVNPQSGPRERQVAEAYANGDPNALPLVDELASNIDRYCASQYPRGSNFPTQRAGSPVGVRLRRGDAGSTHAVLGIKPSGRMLRFPGSIGTGPRTPVVHDRGSRGRFPMVTGVTFLEVMGWSPAGWCGLTRGEKLHVAKAFELANPGSITNIGAFVRDLDGWCASHGYRSLAKPSGDISIPSGLTGADWVPYGTTTGGWAIDDLGNYVSIDSSGHPIQGTVRETADPNSTPINDSDLDLGSLEFVSGSDSGDGGTGGGSSAARQQPDASTRAAWQAVNSLIGAAGTDLAALITAGNRTELANINANLQLALRNSTSPTTGQALTHEQIAQLQRIDGYMNPKPAISTPVAVGGGVILAAVLAKALDWI